MTRDVLAMLACALAGGPAGARAAGDEGLTGHVSVEVDAGFVEDYDESRRWGGGFGAGVGGWWALEHGMELGARFGVMHWSYDPAPDIAALVPEGLDPLFEQSTGQIQVLTLTPLARWQHDDVAGRLGMFVQGGAGVAYVKTYSRLELEYGTPGGDSEVVIQVVDETDWHAGATVAVGLTRPMSSSSWLELFPSCQWIFSGETVRVFALSFGFRVRV